MFIFIRLLLAHLIGDFLLQFNAIHRLKSYGLAGITVHVLIIIDCLIILSWPYLHRTDIWVFIAFIGMTHIIQDWAKLKFTKKSDQTLLLFLIDQMLHISIIALLFITGLQTIQPLPNSDNHILLGLYNNNVLILFLIAVIIASYAGHYFIILCKKNYLKKSSCNDAFGQWYGYIERAVIVSTFFAEKLWPLLIPLIIMARPLLFWSMKDRLFLSEHFVSKTDITMTCFVGVTVGFIFYQWI